MSEGMHIEMGEPLEAAYHFWNHGAEAIHEVSERRSVTAAEWFQMAQCAATFALVDELTVLNSMLMGQLSLGDYDNPGGTDD